MLHVHSEPSVTHFNELKNLCHLDCAVESGFSLIFFNKQINSKSSKLMKIFKMLECKTKNIFNSKQLENF